jgi:hypothetical protein
MDILEMIIFFVLFIGFVITYTIKIKQYENPEDL